MTENIEFKLKNYINGEYKDPIDLKYIESFNPSTGKAYCLVPDSDSTDVDLAVQAAKLAFEKWSRMTRKQRSDIMNKIAELLEDRLEEFAKAESKDQGKPVSLAMAVDIPRVIYNFRYFAGKILYLEDKKTELDGLNAINYVQRMPIGVAGLISPWNLPLYLLTWKIAPCIAAGNTCICKPSELTSVTAYMLCSVLEQAGLPSGVVNMIFGTGPKAGSSLVCHADVPLISFTGGTVTGAKIISASAPHYKKLSLELGGKNANIVFEDCEFDHCVETTVRSSFANQGEICLCGSRVFVQRNIYAKFVRELKRKVNETIKVGDPSKSDTKMGALVSKEHLEKVLYYVELAKKEGGEVYFGGERITSLGNGYFMEPTCIITEPLESCAESKRKMNPQTCRVMQEEIFGPVITVTPFDTEEQVIEWANGTKYGLSASVWSLNTKTSRRVAEAIKAGTVWVNCWMIRDLNMPFGGMRQSGLGREGGDYSTDFFTEMKTICLSD